MYFSKESYEANPPTTFAIRPTKVKALVIPPISTAHRSRDVMQPWPDAALG
jgi:hypothetical protein